MVVEDPNAHWWWWWIPSPEEIQIHLRSFSLTQFYGDEAFIQATGSEPRQFFSQEKPSLTLCSNICLGEFFVNIRISMGEYDKSFKSNVYNLLLGIIRHIY